MNDINQIETMPKTKKKNNLWIFLILVATALGIFVYFFFGIDKLTNQKSDDIVMPTSDSVVIEGLPTDDTKEVAVVNGEVITQGDVNQLINSELINQQKNFADLSAEEQTTLQTQSTESMIDYTLLLQAAKASNLTLDTDAATLMTEIKKTYSDEELNSQLTQLDLTEDQFAEVLLNAQLIDLYITSVVLKNIQEPTEAEIAAQTALVIEQSGGQTELDKQLTQYGMTKEDFADAMKKAALETKQQTTVEAKIQELRGAGTIEKK